MSERARATSPRSGTGGEGERVERAERAERAMSSSDFGLAPCETRGLGERAE